VRRPRPRSRELEERDLPSAARETAVDRSLVGEAIRLQELLGNASATEVLARSPLGRDPAGTEAAPAKGGEEQKGGTYTLTLAEIGTFDVLSASWGAFGGGSGTGSTGKEPKPADLSASKKQDKYTPKIMQALAHGQTIATAELRLEGGGNAITLKLKKGLFTSYQTSEGEPPLEHFSLTFEEHEYDYGEKAK
jgi:type VI protein secretion system component Hcp